MNIVDEIYHDESLGTNINVVLVRMIMVGYRQSICLIERGNPSRSLEQVCRWANTQQRRDPDHAEYHDHAIFLTRQDFGPAGYAPVTGMCHPLRSCTLNHEDGFSSAFVVAHETGHVLGMEHDGQGNRCADETSMGSIMAPLVQAAFHRYHWSRCSKQELNRYIHFEPTTLASNCGAVTQTTSTFVKPKKVLRWMEPSVHQESGASKAIASGDPASNLKAMMGVGAPGPNSALAPGHVEVEFAPAADSATTLRDPAYGGRDCPGSAFDYQMCNTEECAGPYEDFRAQQCIQRSNKYHNNIKHTWLPYEHPDEARKCELSCTSKETGEVVFMNQVMHDGTRCSYSEPFSVCARGECLHVGCDKEVGSYKQEDKCGVCQGDNSHCRTVKLTLTKTPKKNGMLKMFDIPIGARHIVIEENETSPHIIAVKNQVTGNFILNSKSEDAETKTFIENGLQWEYLLEGGKETLKTTGPLHEGIVVLVSIQYTKYGCRRKSDSRLVHRNFCETSKKPKPIRKRCNVQECNQPTWVVEEWSPCSKTCGKLGYQTRAVQCMQPLHNGTNRPCSVTCGEGIQQRQVVCKASDNTIGECEGEKPETVLICKLSSCPGKPVSPLTVETMENSTIKDEAIHQRAHENPVHKISSNEPCLGDKSIFCQMEVLARYCSIPGYNKLCCESCNKKENFAIHSPDLQNTPVVKVEPDASVPTHPASPNAPPPATTQSPLQTTKAASRRLRSTAPVPTTISAAEASPSTGAALSQGPTSDSFLTAGKGDSDPGSILPPGPPQPTADSSGGASKEHSPNSTLGPVAERARRDDLGSERDSSHRTLSA
ncbi:hypothetical protein FQN60_003045 [Etheostoma spectabile]|uniref:Peptidase M12B domain-containing protein n=1 Tax=Etheostoma spectabile TaxID=54343 RepID=A0A5J5CI09_9PERO|nr:hypothetical protein FQN60_003045 [Etheostoma spectabile]